jgi:hypothetical protein
MASPTKILKLDGFVSERTRVLNPIFVDGYADNWYFAVPEAFRDALDIKWTTISEDLVQTEFWTQGSNYSFKAGDTLYDTRFAYEKSPGVPMPWGEALKVMKYCVKVISASPAAVVVTKEFETAGPVPYLEDKSLKDEPATIQYQRTRMSWGHVRFEVWKPNSTAQSVELIEVKETTQELFVSYLQTGIFLR